MSNINALCHAIIEYEKMTVEIHGKNKKIKIRQ